MNEDKFTNYLITSQRFHTPPYAWSDGIFQRYQPLSGEFIQNNKFCGNNGTGRGYYANPCGYSNNLEPIVNSGRIHNDISSGSLFPTINGVMSPPQDKIFHSIKRIGEKLLNE